MSLFMFGDCWTTFFLCRLINFLSLASVDVTLIGIIRLKYFFKQKKNFMKSEI